MARQKRSKIRKIYDTLRFDLVTSVASARERQNRWKFWLTVLVCVIAYFVINSANRVR
ncbi:MAG: hypothetical protein ABSD20_14395 [Terriglobales bacterium]|jgi:uncharacterized membrane protein YkvA (DUF1232 family)